MARSDRPVSRSLVKLGARLLLGGARAHVQDRFPGLRLTKPAFPGEAGRIEYRGEAVGTLVHASEFCRRAGAEIHIVGSGPSIRQTHLSRMPAGTAILLNGAVSLIGEEIARPLAVAVEDERFIFRHFDLLESRGPAEILYLFSTSVLRAICERDRRWLEGRNIVLIDGMRRPYGAPRPSWESLGTRAHVVIDPASRAAISLDPSLGVFQNGSVAVSALQFALSCNPRLIGFAGIDISNASAEPRFYESPAEKAFSGVARAQQGILDHVALVRSVGRERGIEMRNFSPVSALIGIGLDYDDRFTRSPGAD